mmetsp:Transcript_31598/g.58279  ORF Transcript_31598/g.58279 Transcript_31598/m.58279 type:complete len:434 (+) Transcript_31598:52-1353(+)
MVQFLRCPCHDLTSRSDAIQVNLFDLTNIGEKPLQILGLETAVAAEYINDNGGGRTVHATPHGGCDEALADFHNLKKYIDEGLDLETRSLLFSTWDTLWMGWVSLQPTRWVNSQPTEIEFVEPVLLNPGETRGFVVLCEKFIMCGGPRTIASDGVLRISGRSPPAPGMLYSRCHPCIAGRIKYEQAARFVLTVECILVSVGRAKMIINATSLSGNVKQAVCPSQSSVRSLKTDLRQMFAVNAEQPIRLCTVSGRILHYNEILADVLAQATVATPVDLSGIFRDRNGLVFDFEQRGCVGTCSWRVKGEKKSWAYAIRDNALSNEHGQHAAISESDGHYQICFGKFGFTQMSRKAPWQKVLQLRSGCQVRVKSGIASDCEGKLELSEGTIGVVVHIDQDGDAQIKFEDIAKTWIFKEEFVNLEMREAEHFPVQKT